MMSEVGYYQLIIIDYFTLCLPTDTHSTTRIWINLPAPPTQVFSGHLPNVVTAAFASTFLLQLSAGNLGGRYQPTHSTTKTNPTYSPTAALIQHWLVRPL
jgi:hypothetical protein